MNTRFGGQTPESRNALRASLLSVDQSALQLEEYLLRLRINELFLEVLRLLRQQNLTLDERLSSRRRSVVAFSHFVK